MGRSLFLALFAMGCRGEGVIEDATTASTTATQSSSTPTQSQTTTGSTTGTSTTGTTSTGTSTSTFTTPSCTVQIERSLNGASDTSELRAYDAAYPDTVLVEAYSEPFLAGEVTGRSEIERDGAGNPIERRIDEDGDGAWDEITTYVWSANDELLEQVIDLYGDGVVDQTLTLVWQGGMVYERHLDATGDGMPEVSWELTYDADDRLERIEQSGPGPNFAVTTRSYLSAAPSLDHDEAVDLGDDGDIDRTTQRIYDGSERLISAIHDDLVTGSSRSELFSWTAFDEVQWSLVTDSQDGLDVAQHESDFTFDTQDRPLTESVQHRVPGATSGWVDDELRQAEWLWSCP